MRAACIVGPGPAGLELQEREMPVPAADEVLVRVHAVGINRADLLQTYGAYPAPAGVPKDIPGLEYAGTVFVRGANVANVQLGERVYGIVGGGAYAEYLTVHAAALAPIPDGLSFTDAAAIPEAYLTAYDALISQCALKSGERVLIHAAGSGVGLAALQIAKHHGAIAWGTSRTPEKLERALRMPSGLEKAFSNERFAEDIAKLGASVDVVLDLVGGATTAQSLTCLAQHGRIIVLGLVAGAEATLNLGLLLRKRAIVCGSVIRARGLAEKIALHELLRNTLNPLFETKVFAPVLDQVFSLSSVREALARTASNASFGKVVLQVV
jgi:NADPH:quinone reductase